MNIRRFFDHVQLNLHLLGFHRFAAFFGKFGTPALPSELDEHDRPTLPNGIRVYKHEDTKVSDCFYDESLTEPIIKVLNFDPTFNHNSGIDFEKDLAFPTTKLDIN